MRFKRPSKDLPLREILEGESLGTMEGTGRKREGRECNIPFVFLDVGSLTHSKGLSISHAPISNLPERCGAELPISATSAGSALLLLLFLKERWAKKPACEEQGGHL